MNLWQHTPPALSQTSGCMAAEIPRAIGNGQTERAHELMAFYLDAFGRDNFFHRTSEHDISLN